MRARADRDARLHKGWLGRLAVFAGFLVLVCIAELSLALLDSDFSVSHWHDVVLLPLLALALSVAVFWRQAFRRVQAEATRNRELRQELAMSLQRYQSLFDLNPEAAYSFDLDGTFLSANRAAEVLTGYAADELLGTSFAPLIVPGSLEGTMAAFRRACAGEPADYETAILHRDGRRVDLAVKNVPIVVDGAVVGVYGVARDVTRANQANAELTRLYVAIGSTTEGITITDSDLRVTYANSARAAMHGYAEPADLVGRHVAEFFSPGEGARLLSTAAPDLDAGESWTGTATGMRRDGSTFAIEISLNRLAGGEFVSVTRDITARKASEEALRASEQRFRDSLAQITDGYFETDLRSRLTFFNDAVEALSGYSAEELTGMDVRAYTDEENAAEIERQFRAVLDTGKPHGGFGWSMTRADGTVREMESSVALIRNRTGRPTGYRGVLRDVTERKAAERRLRESEERYELVSRATQETLWDTDLLAGTTRCSGEIEKIFGHPGPEITVANDWWFAQIHPDDRERWESSFAALLDADEERLWNAECRVRTHDGHYLDVLTRGYVVRDDSGRPRRFVGSSMDITDRKRHEAHLTAARRDAEEANRAKSMFVANMSHELRTPMHGVIGMVDLLLATGLDDEQAEYAEAVQRSGESLLHIINEVLDLSKIEAGRLTLDSTDFDVRKLVDDAARPLSSAAQRKGIVLTTELGPGVPTSVTGDSWRVGQVLTNLLGNAVKFTDDGTVNLSVHVVERDGDSVLLQFRVEDTGIGMTSEQVDLLFRPFSQMDPSTTRRFGGTGLGLSICRQLAEMMGGRISVESRAGAGSTFTFEVPLPLAEGSETPDTRDPLTEAEASSPTTREDRGEAAPVLLVEDSPVNRKVAMSMLRRLGYTADVATDGLEALSALSRRKYAAVLMDLQMPNMDGYETTRRIRSQEGATPGQEAQRRVPVIAMTASALAGEQERVLAAGMDDYVPKPFRTDDLRVVLDRWASVSSGGGDLGRAGSAGGAVPATAPTGSGGVLDDTVLADLRRLDAQIGNDFLGTLVSEFVSDAGVRLAALRDGVEAADLESVRRTAHLLKGSSGSIGAHALAAVLNEVEELASSGDLAASADLVGAVADEVERAGAALTAAAGGGAA